jgi:hypothetical protein
MDELYSILLSWAVTLSGYPAPAEAPQVVRVPHSFFVENACAGHECQVWGWYAGGKMLYVDSRLDPANNLLGASVVVHEMTHYLQAQAGKLERRTAAASAGATKAMFVDCELTIDLEREAYAVQQAYLISYGVYQPIGVSMHSVGCGEESARERLAHNGGERDKDSNDSAPSYRAAHQR